MSEWSAVLKMVGDAVGVRHLRPTFEKLQAFEAGIYLVQCAGVDMGYGFLPVDGLPHSRALMVDYDRLVQERPNKSLVIGPEAGGKIATLRSAITKPKQYAGTWDEWLIFVAGVAMASKNVVSEDTPPGNAKSEPPEGWAARIRESLNGAGIAA
ncbi:MAG: hypothetical protein M3N49_03010 [Candidatus Eremiobacteraeota bacterium]|nr:hypothetical protein [Candidatus Eremiobacteraeota bacterium]